MQFVWKRNCMKSPTLANRCIHFGSVFGRWSAFASSAGTMLTPTPHMDPRFEPLVNPWTCLLIHLGTNQKKNKSITESKAFTSIDPKHSYGRKHRQTGGFQPGAGQECKKQRIILSARPEACAARSAGKNVSLAHSARTTCVHSLAYVSFIAS